ncbi:MAG: GtrA family protein [Gammaproteobacteria bacterium]|nr:GtrA family protein [Gammaproteobacteria bacterium]MCH9743677.1 GtrA family protein [Gammaproteobacteria bacterium]
MFAEIYKNNFIKFLLAGGPAFLLGVVINYLLVDKLLVGSSLAYVIVLMFQVTCNFFICKKFVFKSEVKRSFLYEFARFFSGIIAFRVLDWCLYSLLVSMFHVYYLAAQILNIIVFSLLKYSFSSRVFR